MMERLIFHFSYLPLVYVYQVHYALQQHGKAFSKNVFFLIVSPGFGRQGRPSRRLPVRQGVCLDSVYIGVEVPSLDIFED